MIFCDLKELAIIEHYGPLVRIGIEGQWVEFVAKLREVAYAAVSA